MRALFAMIFFGLSACSVLEDDMAGLVRPRRISPTDAPKPTPVATIGAEQAASRALTHFLTPAAAVSVQLRLVGERCWVVEVMTISGASVFVRLRESSGALAEAWANSGPFDYDFRAEEGRLTLTEAFAKARAAQSGEVSEWRLQVTPDGFNSEIQVRSASGTTTMVPVGW